MPVGFVLLGIALIYIILFTVFSVKKVIVIASLCFLLGAYFYNPTQVFGVYVNIPLIAVLPVAYILFLKNLTKKQFANVVSVSILSVICYVTLCALNSDYIFTLNPIPTLLCVTVVGAIYILQPKLGMFYLLNMFVLLSLSNVYVESELGSLTFANVELFNYLIIGAFVYLLVNYFYELYAFRRVKL